MAERTHLTQEEWEDLEPLLCEAERHAHEEYFAQEAPPVLHNRTEVTPGGLLLRRLIAHGDQEAVALFRAAEMYFHELSRHGYAAAYLRGKEVGGEEAARRAA
jgi:hypothetical protein